MSNYAKQSVFMQMIQDIRASTFDRLSFLIGSSEHVSDNLEELAALDRWERDESRERQQVFTLSVEIAIATEELRRSREWMWDARGLDRTYEAARQTTLRAIQALRGLRWEWAQMGGMQS